MTAGGLGSHWASAMSERVGSVALIGNAGRFRPPAPIAPRWLIFWLPSSSDPEVPMTTVLFSIEPPANASHGYVNLYSAATDEHRKIREHCEYLWRLYKPYADKNFLPEFVLHFHERWFEMYLGACLLTRGVALRPCKLPGPDLLAQVDGRRVWI